MKENKVVHLLRYGTVAEKAQLEKAKNIYDYLIINGNSAAYISRAIAKFVVENFFSSDQGFVIDPITYAFQRIDLLKNKSKNGEKVLKKSIAKLIEKYESPVKDKIESNTSISPIDFSDSNIINNFCHRVLNFQYSIVSEYITNNDLGKYLQYVTEINLDFLKQFHPKFLIAPYFYLNSTDLSFDDWLNVNIQFLNTSVKQSMNDFNSTQVFGQIVINKDVLLNRDAIQKIVIKYNQCDCAGFTVWVDGLDEHEDSLNLLNGFLYFLNELKRKPVYNMYGGFFSILLTHQSIGLLNGVSHGMEYGESREVYPVGGGLPVSKYYYMPLHQRKEFTNAFRLLEHNNILDRSLSDWGDCTKYFNEICRCKRCQEIMENSMANFLKFESDLYYDVKRQNGITRRKKASSETKENCLYHYLLCKDWEFKFVKKRSIQDIVDILQADKEKYISCPSISNDDFNYIDNWCKSLTILLDKIKGTK
jgi:hypothetical protein